MSYTNLPQDADPLQDSMAAVARSWTLVLISGLFATGFGIALLGKRHEQGEGGAIVLVLEGQHPVLIGVGPSRAMGGKQDHQAGATGQEA